MPDLETGIKPMHYWGWFAAIQLGWPQPAGSGRCAAVWQPPDFRSGRCSLACTAGGHSGKMDYYWRQSIRINTIEVHFKRVKSYLRMSLENVYVDGYTARTAIQNLDAYEEWTLDVGKGSAWVLVGPTP